MIIFICFDGLYKTRKCDDSMYSNSGYFSNKLMYFVVGLCVILFKYCFDMYLKKNKYSDESKILFLNIFTMRLL